jgi:hypothetical protein
VCDRGLYKDTVAQKLIGLPWYIAQEPALIIRVKLSYQTVVSKLWPLAVSEIKFE